MEPPSSGWTESSSGLTRCGIHFTLLCTRTISVNGEKYSHSSFVLPDLEFDHGRLVSNVSIKCQHLLYNSVQFVCSRLRQKLHQTLRDYEVRFRECPPRVKIDRPTVHVENL